MKYSINTLRTFSITRNKTVWINLMQVHTAHVFFHSLELI